MYTYMYMYIYICIHMHTYVYIYRVNPSGGRAPGATGAANGRIHR